MRRGTSGDDVPWVRAGDDVPRVRAGDEREQAQRWGDRCGGDEAAAPTASTVVKGAAAVRSAGRRGRRRGGDEICRVEAAVGIAATAEPGGEEALWRGFSSGGGEICMSRRRRPRVTPASSTGWGGEVATARRAGEPASGSCGAGSSGSGEAVEGVGRRRRGDELWRRRIGCGRIQRKAAAAKLWREAAAGDVGTGCGSGGWEAGRTRSASHYGRGERIQYAVSGGGTHAEWGKVGGTHAEKGEKLVTYLL
ncbi:hypothetical protein ACP4OV_002345 [Aristida adscensionis]